MSRHVIPGDPPIELTVRRSQRARRISLTVASLDASVVLTVPRGVSERQALDFAEKKEDWLRQRLSARPNEIRVGHGTEIPFQDETLRILPGRGRSVKREGDWLLVPGTGSEVARRTRVWLANEARVRLAKISDDYAAELGRSYTRLTIRDTRSRWGSCSASGGLMYSWRLVMAPAEVLRYVAAHEVAHLVEPNHSSAFWRKVEELKQDYRDNRRWLRANGNELHRYRFEA